MVVVAQLVRALVCGTRGRGFESHLPPKSRCKRIGFFLCKTGFKAAQHGVLGVFCLIRTELARGRKKQKCPKMPQALSCDSPATTKPRIAYYRLLRTPAASGNGNAQPARASTIPPNEGMAEAQSLTQQDWQNLIM